MIPVLILIFFFTLIDFSLSSRIESYLKTIALQGLLLFLLIMMESRGLPTINVVFLVLETLGLKTLLIPYFLFDNATRNNVKRDVGPDVIHFYPIVISSFIILLGFFATYWALRSGQVSGAFYLGASVSTIITSFYIILLRKKIITHVIGFIVLENGIFLLSMAFLKEMPMFISIGMILDIFIAVFVFGLFMNKINTEFDKHDIDTLTTLKD